MPERGHPFPPAKRRVIRELEAQYVVPADLDVIRVLLIEERPNNDGGTGSHRVYVCLCEEINCG